MMWYEGNRGGEISRLITEALSLHSLIVKELTHPSCAALLLTSEQHTGRACRRLFTKLVPGTDDPVSQSYIYQTPSTK